MLRENFSDVLFIVFYTLVFLCWSGIFLYGILRLTEKKKK